MSVPVRNRQWLLRRRPCGRLGDEDLELATAPVPTAADGEVLLRVRLLCMDPTIRNFMDAEPGYGVPIDIGGAIRGMVLGEVVESGDPSRRPGDLLWGFGSWSDYVAAPAARFFAVPTRFGRPLPAYVHALGTIGLTAHYGLFDVARLQPGETVLVSGAAGAVGSLVGQMARIAGASRVVGIAGGEQKCRRAVERYGFDACINYKTGTRLDEAVAAALPEGIDVVFENVGGGPLEAALAHLRKDARIALCGMIAGYGASEPVPGPANLWNLVVNTALMRGFLVTDVLADTTRCERALEQIDGWSSDGRLRYDVDLRRGFERIPEYFNCLFTGAHDGRLVVALDD